MMQDPFWWTRIPFTTWMIMLGLLLGQTLRMAYPYWFKKKKGSLKDFDYKYFGIFVCVFVIGGEILSRTWQLFIFPDFYWNWALIVAFGTGYFFEEIAHMVVDYGAWKLKERKFGMSKSEYDVRLAKMQEEFETKYKRLEEMALRAQGIVPEQPKGAPPPPPPEKKP